MPQVNQQIVGLGGGGDTPEQTRALMRHALSLTGKERRRPRYRELVEGGFPPGIAADDGVGLHYVGTELQDVVTCRPGAADYRVTLSGEERLEARLILR
jgi:hypothetical protein